MKSRLYAVLGTFALIVLAASCNDSNNVTAPSPNPVGTPPVSATPTPIPSAQTAVVNVGPGGGMNFADAKSGGSTTTIRAGDTVRWVWVSGFHSTTSGACPGGTCQPSGVWDSGAGSGMTFSHTFPQAGSFPYFCSAHGAMMQGTVVVQ